MKRIMVITCILLLTGCNKYKEKIGNKIETNLNNCKIIEKVDTHGGFLGDGDFFAKMSCSNLEITNNWKKMPLPDEIKEVLDIKVCSGDGCKNFFENFNVNIEEGYYFFLDRHSESNNKYDYTDLNNRSSYNFSVALYDSKNELLYFYEMDT